MNALWNDVKPSTTVWNVSSEGRMVVLFGMERRWHQGADKDKATGASSKEEHNRKSKEKREKKKEGERDGRGGWLSLQ